MILIYPAEIYFSHLFKTGWWGLLTDSMPFNSPKYFMFIPAAHLVFYFVGDRARWCVLLAASLLFYAALNVPFLPVVLAGLHDDPWLRDLAGSGKIPQGQACSALVLKEVVYPKQLAVVA